MLKIKVNKNGKEYYADSDKVFTWLMERYLSNEVRKTQAKLEPYKVRLDNFFESLKTTELEWYEELQKAYPAIDLDFALKRAKLWLSSNYKKDFKKFLMNWMSKENPTIQIEQKRDSKEYDKKRIENANKFKELEKLYKEQSHE